MSDILEYQDRVVAFVDILGFKALTLTSGHNMEARAKINELVITNQIFDDFYKHALEFGNATFFLDSFVVSMEPAQAWYLFRHTGQLCRYLLLRGLPCRGAITAGQLYHNDRVIVGPALVRAYELEQAAEFPRVVLDQSAFSLWRDDALTWELASLMKTDAEGFSFIDLFNPRWADSFVPWPDGVPSDNREYLELASERIAAGLRENKGEGRVYKKYEWLAAECTHHQ